MVNKEINKKEVLQCRSCHNTFHQSDVKEVKTERCGLEINEKTCPYCGGHTYGLVEYPVDEFDLIYKSNKPSELIIHMNKLTEEVLKEDMKKIRNNNVKTTLPRKLSLQQKWEIILKNDMRMRKCVGMQ